MEAIADLRKVCGVLMRWRAQLHYRSDEGPWFVKFNGSDPVWYIHRELESRAAEFTRINRELGRFPSDVCDQILSHTDDLVAKKKALRISMKSDERRLVQVISRAKKRFRHLRPG